MELHFLPYGRVDAILIGHNDHWAFIDGGYRKDGIKAVQYMHSLGINHIDAYIVSHKHKNHIGAAPYIIEAMRPDMIYYRGKDTYGRLLDLAKTKQERETIKDSNYRFQEIDDTFNISDIMFTCVGMKKIRNCLSGAISENYNSMILRMDYNNMSAQFTGDTSDSILKACSHIDNVTIYKNHHHNGVTSKALLKRMSPRYVIVCNSSAPSKSYQKTIKSIGATQYTVCKKENGVVIIKMNENNELESNQ